jgi:membrane protein
MKKIKHGILLLMQRLLITFELFNRNGLMNHAAACAYGFLLSAAPALLFISFVVSRALSASPELMESMLRQIGFLFSVFNVKDLINNFLGSANSGLAGLIWIITTLWTARLCALSAQRGLGVIFPGPRSVFRDNAVMLGLGLLTMLFIFGILLSLRLALNVSVSPGAGIISIISPVFILLSRFFFLLCLALLALSAYRFVPAQTPKLKYIIPGVLVCIVFYQIFTAFFSLIISSGRYDLLYGTLGRLFLFLIKVYFFFVFFFFGAQMIHVLGISEALLFSRFRKFHSKGIPPKKLPDRLFTVPPGPLEKYTRIYKEGEFVFTKGSRGHDAYYILSGTAGVYLDQENRNRVAVIDKGHFFGEMGSISSEEERAASIKAETDISVLTLPPGLFRLILKIDPDTDQNLIKTLSQRLKAVDEQLVKDNA